MDETVTASKCRRLAAFTILSGAALAALFAIGVFDGIHTRAFKLVYFLHILLQFGGILLSLRLLLHLSKASSWPAVAAPACALLFTLLIVTAAAAPATCPEALAQDLFLVKTWLGSAAARIGHVEWHEPSYYPMLAQAGFVLPLENGGPQLCALYHFSFLLLLSGLAAGIAYGESRDADSACAAYLLTLSLPAFVELAASPLTHLAPAAFAAAGVLLLLEWSRGASGFPALGLAGLAIGLCAHSSAAGGLAAALMLVLMVILGIRSGKHGLDLAASICFVGLIIAGANFFLLLRNLLWTANPFYPAFRGLIGSSEVTFKYDPFQTAPLLEAYRASGYSWLDVLLLPLRLLTSSMEGFGAALSPLLLLAALPLFARKQNGAAQVFLYLFLAFYVTFALLLRALRISEYAPLFGLIPALAAIGLKQGAGLFKGRLQTTVIGTALGLHLLFAGVHAVGIISDRGSFPFLFGTPSESAYLERQIKDYPMIRHVNESAKDGVTLMLLAPANFYYYQVPIVSEGADNAQQLAFWLAQQRTARLLAIDLQNMGVKYLLIDNKKASKSLQKLLGSNQLILWQDFVQQYLEPLQVTEFLSLYELRDNKAKKSI